MREVIFSDPARRERLESILHPIILDELQRLSARLGGPYQILVIPLLVEGGLEGQVDRVLVVDASLEATGRAAAATRRGKTSSRRIAIVAAQAQRQTRLAKADDVIRNDGQPQ